MYAISVHVYKCVCAWAYAYACARARMRVFLCATCARARVCGRTVGVKTKPCAAPTRCLNVNGKWDSSQRVSGIPPSVLAVL
jgi:hypothetical protein